MKHDRVPVALIALMFLTVGVMFCMNDILLPVVKERFQLNYVQATSIQISFYIVYLIWPLMITRTIQRYGYRTNIVGAMIICLVGCLLFVPAYFLESFALILAGVFILSTGVTVINVAANPYAALLGTPDGANMRLNFVQAFSRVGYAATPVLANWLIYNNGTDNPRVHVPYLILALLILVVIVAMVIFRMPNIKPEQQTSVSLINMVKRSRQHPQLFYGLPVMFFYVGAEACTSGFFISYMTTNGYSEGDAATFLTLYYVLAAICALLGTVLLKIIKPGSLVALFGTGMIICYIASIAGDGAFSAYSLIAAGGFLSVLFPTVFGLAIEDLGDFTEHGSALLNIMIVGGAVFPPIQGLLADTWSVNVSYLVPAVCIGVVTVYGLAIGVGRGKVES